MESKDEKQKGENEFIFIHYNLWILSAHTHTSPTIYIYIYIYKLDSINAVSTSLGDCQLIAFLINRSSGSYVLSLRLFTVVWDMIGKAI